MTENTGVGSLSRLQWIFLTQELNQGLLHCRRILYHLSYQPSRARDKWLGNFNTLCYTLFFLVCIIFYDIRGGALTWTREGDIKRKVAFILYFLALSFFFFSDHTTWSLWDPTSPTRNWIQAASSDGAESEPLDFQGILKASFQGVNCKKKKKERENKIL